jgi:hypothetical protein
LTTPAAVDEQIADFSARVIDAASQTLISTSGLKPTRPTSLWWSEACQVAVLARQRAQRAVICHPLVINLIDYKRKTAEAHNCLLQQCEYKQCFLQEINFTVPFSVAWRKLRILPAHLTAPEYPLVVNGQPITNTQD